VVTSNIPILPWGKSLSQEDPKQRSVFLDPLSPDAHSHKLFGTELDAYAPGKVLVPKFVTMCITLIEMDNHMKEKGIYEALGERDIPETLDEQRHYRILKDRLNSETISDSSMGVMLWNVNKLFVERLFKSYFSELPEPLFGSELLIALAHELSIASNPDPDQIKLASDIGQIEKYIQGSSRELITGLSRKHRATLACLLDHFYRLLLPENATTSGLTVEKLAEIWAPSLLFRPGLVAAKVEDKRWNSFTNCINQLLRTLLRKVIAVKGTKFVFDEQSGRE